MDRLGEIKRTGEDDPDFGIALGGRDLPRRSKPDEDVELPERSPEVATDNEVFVPPFLGSKVIKGISIDEISNWVNETGLFRNQWQFRPEKDAEGKPESDAEFKDRIRPILRDQLAGARAEGLLVPQVVYGFFPANADGQDLVIWTDESRATEAARFSYPRQRKEPYLCIADFFRPLVNGEPGSGEPDYAAFQIVSMGSAVSERCAELFAADKYQDYLLLHGLGVEMAEALAEMWHRRIREEWGFADQDPTGSASAPTKDALVGLFRQKYRSGRYSWGYPACPDLADNLTVAELLEVDRIGVEVSEETGFQYHPEQTTSAIICHHPRAKYFVAR